MYAEREPQRTLNRLTTYNLLHFTVDESKESSGISFFFISFSNYTKHSKSWQKKATQKKERHDVPFHYRKIRIWRRQFSQWQIKLDLQRIILGNDDDVNLFSKTNDSIKFILIHTPGTSRWSLRNDADDRKSPKNFSTWTFSTKPLVKLKAGRLFSKNWQFVCVRLPTPLIELSASK